MRKILPNENIVYFGDTGRVPYGTRSRDTIRKYAFQDAKFLLKHNVKMVIAACGTVSSVAMFFVVTGVRYLLSFANFGDSATNRVIELGVLCVVGVIVYFVMICVLRVPVAVDILNKIRKTDGESCDNL